MTKSGVFSLAYSQLNKFLACGMINGFLEIYDSEWKRI